MNHRNIFKILPMAAAISASPVSAQMLEEVVVTAQKREQSLQDVGIAVTAFSGSQLQDMGMDSVSKIQDMTPNLRIKPTITGVAQYSIRGVGENADTSALSSSPVGIHVNEVAQPYPVTATNLLFDLERVEVLRGPQGDLFGLNTTGGTINFITEKPSQEFAGSIMGEVGNYDRYKLEGYINGGLTEALSARLALSQNKRTEGWQKNEATGEKLGEMDKTGARLGLRFEPSDTFTADLELHYSKDDSDAMGMRNVNNFMALDLLTFAEELVYATPAQKYEGTGWTSYTRGAEIEAAVGLPDTDVFAPGTKPYIDNKGYGGSLIMNWDLNTVTVTSVTGYEDFEREELNDSDGDELQDSNQWFNSELELWSQEIRIASNGDGDLSWMVGGNIAHDELEQQTMFIEPENFAFPGTGGQNPSQERDIWAIFGHAEYQLNDKWVLIGGLRYTEETREQDDVTTYKMGLAGDLVEILSDGVFAPDYDDPFGQGTPLTDGDFSCFAIAAPCAPGVVLSDKIEFEEWSGKVGVNYLLSEEWLLYGSFSRGFKSGGFLDTAASSSASFVNSDAEFLNAFELGAKGSFMDGRGRLNAAVFYYDYEDQQVNDFIIDPLFGPLGVIVNAPESEIWGGELELIISPLDGLEIVQNLGYTKGEFKDFVGVDADASRLTIEDPANGGFYSTVTVDRSGDEIEMPNLQYSGTIAYTADSGNGMAVRFVVDYSYEDEVETDRVWSDDQTGAQTNFGLDSYWLVNGRISLMGQENWEVTLFGENLLDEEYLLDYTRFNQGVVQLVGMPRTYGLRLKYDF